MSQRVYVSLSTREYARANGISERTARRRIASDPHAYKVGTQWRALVPATTVAKKLHLSPATVRKRKGAVKTSDPMTLKLQLTKPTKRHEAQMKYFGLLTGRDVNANTIANRSRHWTTRQMNEILRATTFNDIDWDMFNLGGGDNSLFYHDE